MPFPRAFYRAVANLSRPRPQGEGSDANVEDNKLSLAEAQDAPGAAPVAELGLLPAGVEGEDSGSHRVEITLAPIDSHGEAGAPQRVEIDLIDLDFNRPEDALEALRRVVAEAREGEQLVLLRKAPAKRAKSPRRTRKSAVETDLSV